MRNTQRKVAEKDGTSKLFWYNMDIIEQIMSIYNIVHKMGNVALWVTKNTV